ncbi:nucleoside-diphosphate-sugar epimerase [Geothermobacter ehrlichii]|uniref:Nucleoside-diphosphate-sugar epimerase n=1 Tax=Geothermobacter ehrlichii TaxID=213224 RepID=A0A5D3WNN2_9BACT|nr:SDR family oxidoreductase [Geothermobacter ehrlichii]TYO98969.1 nucleoside-diphosphate-sugar epimerase [Geothermobacter ehrlichii]
MKHLFIVGCGDIGRRTARLAMEQGMSVTGVVRSEKSARLAEAMGIRPIVADLMDSDSLDGLPTAGSLVLYAAPPPGGGMTDPKVRHFCQAVTSGEEPTKLVYLSTSGVYGDCGGARVTEETPVNPQTARARRRFDAETTIRRFGEERSVPTVILRVTGIYGPFRFALHRIVEGHPLLDEREAPCTNRIHADDLAQVCLAALEKGKDGEIFNVCDGQESTMTHYFNAVADAFGLPRPPQVSMEEAKKSMNPLMLSYFQESRRMDNSRMRERLGVRLRYPTLEEGLAASVAEMKRTDPDFFARLRSLSGSLLA